MGRLQRIEGTINSTISHYGHIKIFNRGLLRFADSLLRGTVRFGKRTGNTISVLNPDNTFEFATAPQTRDTKVTLSRTTEWLTPGAIVSLGPGRELHRVEDVIDATVLLEDNITQEFTTEDRLLIHSYPMLSSIDTPAGATTITVKSHYQLANGDIFAYLQSQELLQSLTEVRITKATRLGTTTDTFFTLLYNLELESPVQTTVVSNSTVYQRAYPAYFSALVRVPNALFTSEPIGPFLVDTLSGKLLEGSEFRETLGLRTINRTGGFVLGDTTSFVTVDKNFLILDRTIPAHTPVISWELAEGTTRISPNRSHFRVGDNLKFSIGIKAVPNFPSDRSWRISLVANEDCSIRFFFNPHPFQEFILLSGINQTVTITIPAGAEVTDIEINVLAFSNTCEVQLADWTPATDTVEQLQYTIIAEAIGDATYQSTGLIIKPYFLGSEFLKGTHDVGDTYDGGKVYF